MYCEDAAALGAICPTRTAGPCWRGAGKAFTPQEAPEHYALLVRWAGAVFAVGRVESPRRPADQKSRPSN
ncbi:MAG: hypothetical protein ACLVJ8_13495 [Ruthenibacterium lactatiformans]